MAILNEVPPGQGDDLSSAASRSTSPQYAKQLFESIKPLRVQLARRGDLEGALGRRRGGADRPGRHPGSRSRASSPRAWARPTVELILNSKDPLERQFAEQTINARVNDVEQAVSKQVLRVAVSDLRQVLNGGKLQFLGQNVPLLGLRNSRTIIQGTIASLPPGLAAAPGAPAGRQLRRRWRSKGWASPRRCSGSIGKPLTVDTTELSGKTTPTDAYAAAIAVIVSLMFVTLLLASGLLAIERSENAYSRLVRGLVSPLGSAVGEGRRCRPRAPGW